ncbi:hypothetical protein OAJ43_00500 [Nitrosomonadales bacterium]|nr:hypothetical protein [Nitrosomonadales bacterium]
MKKLLLLLLLIPNLSWGGLLGGSKETTPGKNPFELLKGFIDDSSTVNNDEIGNDSAYWEKRKKELLKEKARTQSLSKMVFPYDVEGAEEIFADPELKKISGISPKYFTGGWDGYQNKLPQIKTQSICELNINLPTKNIKNYEADTRYRFIAEYTSSQKFNINNNSVLGDDDGHTQVDFKINPILNEHGLVRINPVTQYEKKYYTGLMYITFYSSYQSNGCIFREFDSLWYEPNEANFQREFLAKNYFGSTNEKITLIFLNEKKSTFGSALSIHNAIINSKSNVKNAPLKIYCPSCLEQKEYIIDVDIKSYKQKYAKKLKKEADRKKQIELEESKERKTILNKKLAPMRKQCEELGFKKGTKKFKNCVVELM